MIPILEGLVTASGEPAHGYPVTPPNKHGRGTYRYPRKCSRCGGAGGWQGWPGFTCFDCGGSGKAPDAVEPCFTPEGFVRYDTARRRREELKQAKAIREAIAREEARNAFIEANPICQWLLALPMEQRERSRFLESMHTALERWNHLTPAQLAALIKARNEMELRAQADAAKSNDWIGEPGDILETELTCCHVVSIESQYGTSYLHICEDGAGRSVIYKGTAGFLGKGETGQIRAKIKAHDLYNGRRQTIIQRPKVL